MSDVPAYQRLLAELKRRRVFRAAAGYGAVAFVVLQVVELLADGLQLPPIFLAAFTILALLGFPVALVLAWLLERAPEGNLRRTTDATTSEIEGIIQEPRIRRWPAGIFALGGAALLFWGAWLVADRVTKSELRLDSIAVLPLENLTGNPEQEYVADGLTEALIGSLGQISGLERVISRTSVMPFKNSGTSLPEIGRALDVNALVEGSVRAYGEQIQIDVRLIEAETEERVWEESFTRAVGDVLALQNEVAMSIARTVSVRLTALEEARLTRFSKVSPEGFDLYLRGRQAQIDGAMAQHRTIPLFEQAIAVDSSFAPTQAALASELAIAGRAEEARRFAERAIGLDPSLSEARVALGLIREWVEWDWAGAEAAFQRAIELNPGDAFAHHELGQLRMRQGRFEEALASERQALLLDPLNSRYQSGLGEMYFHSGRYDEAAAQLERVYASNPHGVVMQWLGAANFASGAYEEALAWWGRTAALRVGPIVIGDGEIGRARHAAVRDDRDQALALIEEWTRRGESVGNDLDPAVNDIAWNIATVYADLGEHDLAIDWLERAYESGFGFLIYVKVSPQFERLHEEPRFQALLEKMGLD